MRLAIVFNPTARGEKARRFRTALAALAPDAELLPTQGAGSASQLTADAAQRGVEVLVAAGGDGTVSEVADGLASVPGALAGVRLGIVPLGTVNVFARELGLPRGLDRAWEVIRGGHERRVDLPCVETGGPTSRCRRHFVQLAGCGLDSRAIAAVSWEWKKRVGPLAYVAAVLRARRGPQPRARIRGAGQSLEGELVLIGNGHFYAGDVSTFARASLEDGVLDARVFARVTLLTLCRFGLAWLGRRPLGRAAAAELQGPRFDVVAAGPMPVQVDGDNIGHLPALFTVAPGRLRVLCPGPPLTWERRPP
jgi:diacylglycerol kinase (ATP)